MTAWGCEQQPSEAPVTEAPVTEAPVTEASATDAEPRFRLTERLATPLVLLGSVGSGEGGTRLTTDAELLLGDPGVQLCLADLGLGSGSNSAGEQLRGLIDASTGEFELAIKSLGHAPILVGRFALDADRAAAVQGMLDAERLTRPGRRYASWQAHVMRNAAASRHPFELVLAGRELLVANDSSVLSAVLCSDEANDVRRSPREDAEEESSPSKDRGASSSQGATRAGARGATLSPSQSGSRSSVVSSDERRAGPTSQPSGSSAQDGSATRTEAKRRPATEHSSVLGDAWVAGALASDPGFRALTSRLRAEPGSVVIWLDWARLSRVLAVDLGQGDQVLCRALGLDGVRRVVAHVRSDDDSKNDGSGSRARKANSRRGGELRTTILCDEVDVDGSVFTSSPRAVAKLVRGMPARGMASLVLAVDDERLTRAPRARSTGGHQAMFGPGVDGHMAGLGSEIRDLFGRQFGGAIGFDLLEPAAYRAATRAPRGQQEDANGPGRATGVLSLRAKDRGAASTLFRSVRDQFCGGPAAANFAECFETDSGLEVIRIKAPMQGAVTALDDQIVCAADVETLEAHALAERRAASRASARRQQVLRAASRLDADRVAGVFRVDLRNVASEGSAANESRLHASQLDGTHAGVLYLEQRTLRVEMVSPM